MARTKINKRRTKGRWSANIKELSINNAIDGDTIFYMSETLCSNPVQNNAIVNTQFTVKNVELQFALQGDDSSKFDALTGYIMYVPQGMSITTEYPNQHPEYIMAYKYFGGCEPYTADYNRNPAIVKTRLSRRLQTGDYIIFFLKGSHTGTNNDNISITGIVRWWTKAN